jgi:AmmeMemoRadiSam system protein B
MTDARPADLAGRWYPQTAESCERFLADVSALRVEGAPKAIVGAIVPHAGWVYSGAVAYQALSVLHDKAPDADLVIVFGGHLGARDRPRIFIEGAWSTPFGPCEIASALAEDVSMAIESDFETPEDYFDDNAIEVLMPMIKKLWPAAPVLTAGIPPITEAAAYGADIVNLARKRGFERVVIVGSTDLTHYGPNYDYVPQGRGYRAHEWVKTKNDPEVIEKIEALDGAKVLWVAQRSRNACCPGAVAAALSGARKLGATHGSTLRYTTSFDVRPSEDAPSSFVGYAGIVLGMDPTK